MHFTLVYGCIMKSGTFSDLSVNGADPMKPAIIRGNVVNKKSLAAFILQNRSFKKASNKLFQEKFFPH